MCFGASRPADNGIGSVTMVSPSTLEKGDLILVKGLWGHLYTKIVQSIALFPPGEPINGLPREEEKYAVAYVTGNGRDAQLKWEFASERSKILVPNRTEIHGARGNQKFETRLDAVEVGSAMEWKGRLCKLLACRKQECHCQGGMLVDLSDVLTGEKMSIDAKRWDMVTIPVVKETVMQLLDISDDGFVNLMRTNRLVKTGVKVVSQGLMKEIHSVWGDGKAKSRVLITVMKALGEEVAIKVAEAEMEQTERVERRAHPGYRSQM